MRRRLPIGLVALAAVLGPAAAAVAQDAPPVPEPAPAPPAQEQQPAPKPQSGRMRLTVPTGLRFKGVQHVVRGQRVTVVGRVKPYVAGQTVVVRIAARGRKAAQVRARIRPAKGGRGTFTVRFAPRRAVAYRITARHSGTDAQAAFDARAPAVLALTPNAVGSGARGTKVRLLQSGLRRLGFPTGSGGVFDDATARSVLAFRKTNSLGWSSVASSKVVRMVFERRGAYRLRYPKAGRHVEADLSRQVLVLADRGRPLRTYHTSSGTSATPTVRGSYRFYMKQPGTNAKGMVHSSYFIRGYAIPGFASVPLYPASHGCLRVPIPSARSIFDWIRVGDRIFVYS